MEKETKKKLFSRPVIAAIVLCGASIAGVLGYNLPEQTQKSIIDFIMLLISFIPT